MRLTRKISLLTLLFAIILLAGCIFSSQEAKRGSVVENEVLAGTLYVSGGEPAAHAEVRIFPVDYVPNKALLKSEADSTGAFTFQTDSNGRYVVAGLPPGEYNILGKLDSVYSYLDSLNINADSKSIPPDTLGQPGSVTGYVALEPNHDPRTVFVQVLGTDRFVNADSTGKFALHNMADGAYAVRVVTTLPNYTPYFGGFQAKAGSAVQLADTIRLAYTGIPVVRGLRATYDTANAVATITWKPSHYAFLKEYLVYRSKKSDLVPPLTPIARIQDTVFMDTLASSAQGSWPDSGKNRAQFEYRVRVRNLSDEEGLAFGAVAVEVVPMAAVQTKLDVRLLGGIDGRVSIRDTITLAVAWSNPLRANDSLAWIRKSDGTILRAIRIQGREGSDTLKAVMDSSAGQFTVGVVVKDSAGSHWSGSSSVQIVTDPPTANAGPDTTVTLNDAVNLHGRGSDKFGRIVKWEWDLGANGNFQRTSSGDTTITMGKNPGLVKNVLRVTDDDGNTGLDTMIVDVILDVPTLTMSGDSIVTISDTIHLHAKAGDAHLDQLQYAWDFGSGVFVTSSGPDTIAIARNTPGFQKTIARVIDEDGNIALDTLRTQVVDDKPTPTLTLTQLTLSQGGGYAIDATSSDRGRLKWEWDVGGKGIYTIGGSRVFYHPSAADGDTLVVKIRVTDEDGNVDSTKLQTTISRWEVENLSEMGDSWPSPAGSAPRFSLATGDGKIYFRGYPAGTGILYYSYSLVDHTVRKLVNHDQPVDGTVLSTVNGLLYALGRDQTQVTASAFDPAENNWFPAGNGPSYFENAIWGRIFGSATADSRIYSIDNSSPYVSLLDYDVQGGQWTPAPHTQPEEHSLFPLSVTAALGKIYVVDGNKVGGREGLLEYNPGTDTWANLGDLPSQINIDATGLFFSNTFAMAGSGSNVYIISGTTMFSYDIATKTFKKQRDLPYQNYSNAAVAMDGKIYVLCYGNKMAVYDTAFDW